MKCVICKHGEALPGTATVTLESGEATLVVKLVPARVCANCGEEYVAEETAGELLRLATASDASGVHVDVREYVAA